MPFNTTHLFKIVLFVVALTLAGIALTYNSTRIITRKTVENHQQSIAREAAKIVDLWLEQHLNIINATGEAVEQIPIGNTSETLRLLKMAMKAGNFSDVYIGLKDGTMIDGADWAVPAGYDPRKRPWYEKAVLENKISLTTPYRDLTTGKMVIAIVKPLSVKEKTGKKAFAGVLSADIILDTLKKNVMNVKIGNTGYTFVIDSQGTILVHPDSNLLMTTKIQDAVPGLSGIPGVFTETTAGTWYYRYRDTQKVLSFQKLVNTGWYLCTTVEKQEAYTLARNTAMLFAMEVVFKILGILMLLMIMIVGGGVFIFMLSRRNFESTVRKHNKILSGKERDLKGEITKRKEIETRYRTLFDMATNAIMISKNNVFIECNEKTLAMFGMSASEIVGKTMLELSPANQQDGNESCENFDSMTQKLIAGEQDIFEWTFKRADESEFPAEVALKTLSLDRELVTIYSIWDISKRALAEQQLRQAQKMAAMGEMLSAIAHQWRQPLNALSTYIASLPAAFYNGMISKSFIEKLVTEADAQIQFMSRTINDFREYFRPSKNKQKFDIMEAVQIAVKLVRAQLKQNGITLKIDSPFDADAQKLPVFGYRNEFVHVLVNIVSNAKDAIHEKEEKQSKDNLRLITISVDIDDIYVNLDIQDSGTGIPDHLLEKIFTPYFSTRGTSTGTGIGLYMAKMIVEKEMKGTIDAQSTPEGAIFTIRLPMSEKK
ncbi:putative Histidine kinase [Desulfamplus magnetovallimortis]|uniref:histidine kinase n=1 Tax=Desulfamplus magnetovallimortis TaxID=1246637 RepID=A0A1W1HAS2_9BACT|nr:cache domain-containing protein [Desulfamplus magnetovallimortis]SLM29591.1 putative Histidine kinase [Desulfamplus magnetovallimortis]